MDSMLFQYLLAGAAVLICLGTAIIGYFLGQWRQDYKDIQKDIDVRLKLHAESITQHSQMILAIKDRTDALSTMYGQQSKDIAYAAKDLAEFKYHVSEHYSKEANTQASLRRIYECMEASFVELRDYMKTLIELKAKSLRT